VWGGLVYAARCARQAVTGATKEQGVVLRRRATNARVSNPYGKVSGTGKGGTPGAKKKAFSEGVKEKQRSQEGKVQGIP